MKFPRQGQAVQRSRAGVRLPLSAFAQGSAVVLRWFCSGSATGIVLLEPASCFGLVG